jgi:hypothetical protein
MNTIQDEIKKFERIQKELAILGAIGVRDVELAKRIHEELESLGLNPATGRPRLKLIKGDLE